MSEILKLILEERSIYRRSKLYKAFVHDKFTLNDKVPIIYRSRNVEGVKSFLVDLNVEHRPLRGDFGIIHLDIGNLDTINDISNALDKEIYFDFSYPIILDDSSSNFNSCVFDLNNSQKLYGSGVVIAFIDSGIDYTINAFRNSDGTTRIKYMYNPSTGTLYNSEQINEALRNENPFSVINEGDYKGHGTEVASIACAGGNINSNLYGVAPRASIISVNSTTNIDSTIVLFHTIMMGLDFLAEKQDEEGFPLVVNLSFSTNYGAHTGTTLLAEYVSNFAARENTSVVVSAGNEGGAAHHKSGNIVSEGENVEIEISGNHEVIIVSLYKGILSDVVITISSPSTGVSQLIRLTEGNQRVRVGGDLVNVLYTGPTRYNVFGECLITIESYRNSTIEEGVWSINIKLCNEFESTYNMWLPTNESVGKGTRFLKPDNNDTLGSPATVYNVISVGSYNYRRESVSIFSGRGSINNKDNLKPDILAPGEDVRVIGIGGKEYVVSGTSFSAPIVSGICALLMEWGIINKNKPNLYGEVIKYFLIRGANRVKNISYPNNSYGYGFVCGSKAFIDVEESINNILYDIRMTQIQANREEDKEIINPIQTYDPLDNINVLKYDDMNINLCPLNSLSDDSRVEFLMTVQNNMKFIDGDYCIYPLKEESEEVYLSILSVPIDKLDVLYERYFPDGSVDIQTSYYYTLCSESISPLSDSGIYQTQSNEYLDLTGRNVIVAIVDTGIDYLNENFMDEFNQTRILEIWDQTIDEDTHQPNVLFGKIYTKEDIDSAIRLKRNGGDPYTIVPSRDTNGHGTSMAGITSSSGVGLVRGAAPESNIVVVKLRELSNNLREVLDFPKDIPIYNEVVLYLALRYLRSIRFKYNKPVSIVLPLQTNAGYHSGESFVSKQITEYSQNSGFVISVPCGDQANKQIHVEGQIYKENQEGVIEFFADKGQTRLTIDIFIENYSKVSFYVISPSGERTREFDVKGVIYNNYSFKFLLEQTEMKIFCEIRQTSVSIIQDIEILFNNLKSGIWQIIIISKDNFPVKYDAYLPIKELLKPDTRFLNSTSISTITQPSSAHLAIAMAYYNQNLTSIVTKSGQGFTLDNRVVPLLAAGGIDILTIGKGGREILMSGSSVAAAVSAGGIALILEWGIVKKNKPNLNSTIIMWLFVSSAITPKGYEYPNRYWGYGILNIRNVFDILR